MKEVVALVEPRLLMRGLRITLPKGMTLHIDSEGLADTDSRVEFCDLITDGQPHEIRIGVALRSFVEQDASEPDT